jgi:hypothetical protein
VSGTAAYQQIAGLQRLNLAEELSDIEVTHSDSKAVNHIIVLASL